MEVEKEDGRGEGAALDQAARECGQWRSSLSSLSSLLPTHTRTQAMLSKEDAAQFAAFVRHEPTMPAGGSSIFSAVKSRVASLALLFSCVSLGLFILVLAIDKPRRLTRCVLKRSHRPKDSTSDANSSHHPFPSPLLACAVAPLLFPCAGRISTDFRPSYFWHS